MFARRPLSSFQGRQYSGWVCDNITFRWVCLSTCVAESREDIHDILRTMVGCLEDSGDICKAAVEGVSRLAEQGMC